MTKERSRKPGLEWMLGLITEVRPGEGVTALLLALNIFLLLTAYYVIKPVREALILELEGGAEYKSYMSAFIAMALLGAVPLYSRFASRVARNRLVVGVTLFFVSHLVLFYLAAQVQAIRPWLGLLFYLWVGIFNMMVVAQFWAFSNDIYSEEQGKRLFALIGLGASGGAVFGSWVSNILIQPVGVYQMLLVSGAILATCAAITQQVHARESRFPDSPYALGEKKASESGAPKKPPRGAFALVFKTRYLAMLASFSLIFTTVNTNGEYMLSVLIKGVAEEAAARGAIEAGDMGAFIGATYGNFFLYVNLLSLAFQAFVVSRLVRYLGLGPSFFILPVVALLDSTALIIAPIFAVIRVGKTIENAVDYSLNNTLRNMLWLPTTQEMKYRAKQAVDTFFVRIGDVTSALLVFVGPELMGWNVRAFATANAILVLAWLIQAAFIVRENRRLHQQPLHPVPAPS